MNESRSVPKSRKQNAIHRVYMAKKEGQMPCDTISDIVETPDPRV